LSTCDNHAGPRPIKKKKVKMSENTHILVVDNNRAIRDSLAEYLRWQELIVSTAADAAAARVLLERHPIDLIVLEVMLPGEDGFALCREVAELTDTPVILLSGLADLASRVAGFESGADDYVVKPFDPRELVARIKTVLRRLKRAAHSPYRTRPDPVSVKRYGFENWSLDVEKRELLDPAGTPIALSAAEYRLLRVLVENPHTVLSRDQLLDLTSGVEVQAFDRSIDSQVSRLRKKLETDPRHPSLLKTAWGNGYLFATDVQVLSS
jgi:two-component system OmpR family response regulator